MVPEAFWALIVHRGPYTNGPNDRYPYDWRHAKISGVALLLQCPGDGRHWVNVTSSPARAERHRAAGGQVIGITAEPDRARELLGEYPDQGTELCHWCASAAR